MKMAARMANILVCRCEAIVKAMYFVSAYCTGMPRAMKQTKFPSSSRPSCITSDKASSVRPETRCHGSAGSVQTPCCWSTIPVAESSESVVTVYWSGAKRPHASRMQACSIKGENAMASILRSESRLSLTEVLLTMRSTRQSLVSSAPKVMQKPRE